MEMRISSISFLYFLFFFCFHFSSFVNSQSDSCSSNLNLKGLSFETTSLHCFPVWSSQDYILRYTQNRSDVWSFILSAPNTNSYIAMGFSTDGRMIGSSAIVGWIPTDGGVGTVKRYYLGAQNPNQVLPDQGSLQVIDNSAVIISQSSRLYLAFQLNTTQPEARLIYSVGPQNLLPSSNFRLTQHRDQVSTRLDYQSGQSKSQRPYTKLRRTHGLLNMLGWGILLVIGTMVARYLRHMDPLWFYLHACIQVVAFALGVSGVIAGLVLEDLLSAQVDRHKTIGVFVLVLGCLQVIAFLARPNKESKVRKYWNWYHYTVGRVLIALAISNVFYGIKVGKENKGWNAGYGVTIALLFLTAIVLEVRLKTRK